MLPSVPSCRALHYPASIQVCQQAVLPRRSTPARKASGQCMSPARSLSQCQPYPGSGCRDACTCWAQGLNTMEHGSTSHPAVDTLFCINKQPVNDGPGGVGPEPPPATCCMVKRVAYRLQSNILSSPIIKVGSCCHILLHCSHNGRHRSEDV